MPDASIRHGRSHRHAKEIAVHKRLRTLAKISLSRVRRYRGNRPGSADPSQSTDKYRAFPMPAVQTSETSVTGVNGDVQLALAVDRTTLAMERTYAAWVRTGLAALAAGVASRTLLSSTVSLVTASILASLLIAFSAFCFVAAVWRDLGKLPVSVPSDLRRVPAILLIFANGVMTLISLTALVGFWI